MLFIFRVLTLVTLLVLVVSPASADERFQLAPPGSTIWHLLETESEPQYRLSDTELKLEESYDLHSHASLDWQEVSAEEAQSAEYEFKLSSLSLHPFARETIQFFSEGVTVQEDQQERTITRMNVMLSPSTLMLLLAHNW